MRPSGKVPLLIRDTHAAIVAGGYLTAALVWIWGSDHVVDLIAHHDPELVSRLQSIKGTAFVVGTALGLYAAIALLNRRQRELAEEKRLAEEMLLASSRLEALGTAAGTLVHDFNNTLTVIRGAAELMRIEQFDTQNLPLHVAEIERAALHAEQVTREMMQFMRDTETHFAVGDLGEVLRHSLPVLKRAAGNRVELVLVSPETLPPVRFARAQVERCLLNLVINARDALEGCATRQIRLGAAVSALRGYKSVFHGTRVSGDHAVLTVEDTGCGIPRENLTRIFAPFFTTKPVGKGTGLGLSSVLKVMQTHGGWVEVDSTPGQGTRFTLFFPVVTVPAVSGGVPSLSAH